MTDGRPSDTMVLLQLRKEIQGQIGERNKTIILLRASTITKPPEGASGERSGSVGQLLRLSNKKPQRTQQNDRGFVALAGVGSKWAARRMIEKYQVYNFRKVHRAQSPCGARAYQLTPQKSDPRFCCSSRKKGQKKSPVFRLSFFCRKWTPTKGRPQLRSFTGLA